MACTLLATPSVGTSDWSNFITQVEVQRRGYMAVTFTNFATSAASAIGTGSVIEMAGSIYRFSETAITYTGGGSVNSDLYIYVKPDAVISTASVVAWGSAPVWVDAKQGFYASAASTTRCVGGMYVAAAGHYSNKYLYTPEILNYCLLQNETRPLLKKVVEMGEWNMDATTGITIAHGIDKETGIRTVTAIVLNDTGNWFASPYTDTDTGSAEGLTLIESGTGIGIYRITGGVFDATTFNGTASTVANRGYVYIEYEA